MGNDDLISEEISKPNPVTAVAAWRATHQRVIDLDQRLEHLEAQRRALGEQIKDLLVKRRTVCAEIARLTTHRRPLVSARFGAIKAMMRAAPVELRAFEAALREYETGMRAGADIDGDVLEQRLHVIRVSEGWLRDLVQHPEDGYDADRVRAQVARLERNLPNFGAYFHKAMRKSS